MVSFKEIVYPNTACQYRLADTSIVQLNKVIVRVAAFFTLWATKYFQMKLKKIYIIIYQINSRVHQSLSHTFVAFRSFQVVGTGSDYRQGYQ